MNKSKTAESVKAIWLIHCVSYTAEALGMSISDTARLLDEYDLISPVLSGYHVFHTQGYEYMAEMLTDELRKAQMVVSQ
ncbi:MAG: DUF3791 domain-containing protein [Lachnospiraceae bacterium]|jgi:hypothetical protein|nr:DUF3791 domain-containing protein [Lachnospiraceae bacterium]